MAITIMKDAYLEIDGVDLSDHAVTLALADGQDGVETTAMGTGNRRFAPGLRRFSLAVTLLQDYAAGSVYETVRDLIGTTFPFAVRPRKPLAVSATNPSFSGVGIIDGDINLVAGNVGERVEVSFTIMPGDDQGLTVATS